MRKEAADSIKPSSAEASEYYKKWKQKCNERLGKLSTEEGIKYYLNELGITNKQQYIPPLWMCNSTDSSKSKVKDLYEEAFKMDDKK